MFATLAGTAMALFSIHAMLTALDVAHVALTNYRELSQLPRLPTHFSDAAGQLMREVELTLDRLNDALGKLAHQALTDLLIGIANRRALKELGYQAMKDAQRPHENLCCAIIDVDHFKQINDTHGHSAGDKALVAVAKALSEKFKHASVIGRLSGDEFCLLTLSTDVETLTRTLEALIGDLKSIEISGLPEGTISVSIELAGDRSGNPTLATLLSRADTELYRAKGGRGRVSAAQSS